MGPAQPAPGPGHDRHSVIKPNFTHLRPPFVCGRNSSLLISHFPVPVNRLTMALASQHRPIALQAVPLVLSSTREEATS